MATESGGKQRGRIGNYSFRVVRGKQVVQSRPGPGRMKQTAATKKAAGLFGKSSALAKIIRKGLLSSSHRYYDTNMVSNFTKAMHATLSSCYNPKTGIYNFAEDSFKNLNGVNFNAHSPLQKYLWLMPESTFDHNTLKVTLPAQEIGGQFRFPKNSNYCRISITGRIYNLQHGLLHRTPQRNEFIAEKSQSMLDMQQVEFNVPKGCLCFVGISLDYYIYAANILTPVNNNTFNPIALCALYLNTGLAEEGNQQFWLKCEKAVFG
jgi:hypothetical protein